LRATGAFVARKHAPARIEPKSLQNGAACKIYRGFEIPGYEAADFGVKTALEPLAWNLHLFQAGFSLAFNFNKEEKCTLLNFPN